MLSAIKRKTVAKFEKILYEKIKDHIWNSNPLDYHEFTFIEFLCLPSFSDYFLLQLYWNQKDLHWVRSYWKRENDKGFLEFWLEYACENNEILPLELSMTKEEGKVPAIEINEILHSLNKIQTQSFFLPSDSEKGRCGEDRRLKIGRIGSSITLDWLSSSTPIEWKDLDELTEKIHLLNKKLISN